MDALPLRYVFHFVSKANKPKAASFPIAQYVLADLLQTTKPIGHFGLKCVDSASAPTSNPEMRGHPERKFLCDPSGSSLALDNKPSTTPTSRFTRFPSGPPSAAVKNASGLSILGPTVLWPDRRKSDGGLVDGGSGNKGADKSYMVSAVECRPVTKGETLDAEFNN